MVNLKFVAEFWKQGASVSRWKAYPSLRSGWQHFCCELQTRDTRITPVWRSSLRLSSCSCGPRQVRWPSSKTWPKCAKA